LPSSDARDSRCSMATARSRAPMASSNLRKV
jgi:hypothetical protein